MEILEDASMQENDKFETSEKKISAENLQELKDKLKNLEKRLENSVKKNSQLEARVRDLEESESFKIRDLVSRLAFLESDLTSLRNDENDDFNELEDEIEKLKKFKNKFQSKNAIMKKKLDFIDKKIQVFEGKAHNTSEKEEFLKRMVESLQLLISHIPQKEKKLKGVVLGFSYKNGSGQIKRYDNGEIVFVRISSVIQHEKGSKICHLKKGQEVEFELKLQQVGTKMKKEAINVVV